MYGRMETKKTKLMGAKCIYILDLYDSTTVDRISSVVLRGVSHEGRLVGRGALDQEQEDNRDTRVIQVQAISMT